MQAICLAHECTAETDQNGKRQFQSASPDEITLLSFVDGLGFSFGGVTDQIISLTLPNPD